MSVLSDLERLHAAEDFFAYLQVPYDSALLHIARLHILKRMGKYFAEKNFDGMSDDAAYTEARETLIRAYADFVASRPIDERVFKVLQDHDPGRARPDAPDRKAFVPLAALTIAGH